MKRSELLKFEGRSVRIKYKSGNWDHDRTGIIYAVGMNVIVFWPFEHDDEIKILLEDVSNVAYL